MCQRRVDVHGFKRDGAAALLRLCAECAHVVQPVAELDEDDADIFGHCEQHLADVLDVGFFFVLHVNLHKLSQPVHKHGDVGAEARAERVQIRFVRAVLHRVVQQSRADRVGVESESDDDLRHRQRVGDIRLAAQAKLTAVHLLRIVVRGFNFFFIVISAAALKQREQGGKIGTHGKTFQSVFFC